MIGSKKVGVADTTCAQYDMGGLAVETLREHSDVAIERYTVPGHDELPLACQRLAEEYDCDVVLAFAMKSNTSRNVDPVPASGRDFVNVALKTNTHVLKVFADAVETKSRERMIEILEDRVRGRTMSALELLEDKEALTPKAGQGIRHGIEDEGPMTEDY